MYVVNYSVVVNINNSIISLSLSARPLFSNQHIAAIKPNVVFTKFNSLLAIIIVFGAINSKTLVRPPDACLFPDHGRLVHQDRIINCIVL